jgi:hypothetical protein
VHRIDTEKSDWSGIHDLHHQTKGEKVPGLEIHLPLKISVRGGCELFAGSISHCNACAIAGEMEKIPENTTNFGVQVQVWIVFSKSIS